MNRDTQAKLMTVIKSNSSSSIAVPASFRNDPLALLMYEMIPTWPPELIVLTLEYKQWEDVKEGGIFDGEWNAAGQKDGEGVLLKKNGDWQAGKWNGDELWYGIYKQEGKEGLCQNGRYEWTVLEGHLNPYEQRYQFVKVRKGNGETYEGGVFEGYAEGKGKWMFSAEGSYEGDFFAGRFHGKGKYRWLNGDRFEGSYSEHKRSGWGAFFHKDGDVDEGHWIEDDLTSGTRKMKNGDTWTGEFQKINNALFMHGFGVYTCKNGSRYEGSQSSLWRAL